MTIFSRKAQLSVALCCISLIVGCTKTIRTDVQQCLPMGYAPDELRELKSSSFSSLSEDRRPEMAIALLDCLGDPDSTLRDGVAFETLSAWMRDNSLDIDTVKSIHTRLITVLQSTVDDSDGFRKPFAALVLSEVARVDRLTPFLKEGERVTLVDLATDYVRNINDYRGFDEKEGWRHGIAHGADLLLQLVLNPAIGPDDLVKIREAVSAQVVPGNSHFYVYGESARLARPILFMAIRDDFVRDDWDEWLSSLVDAAPLANWNEAFSSQTGLAKRHNTKAFLTSLYVNASTSSNEKLTALVAPITEALGQVR